MSKATRQTKQKHIFSLFNNSPTFAELLAIFIVGGTSPRLRQDELRFRGQGDVVPQEARRRVRPAVPDPQQARRSHTPRVQVSVVGWRRRVQPPVRCRRAGWFLSDKFSVF